MKKTLIKLTIACLLVAGVSSLPLHAQPDKKEAAQGERKPRSGTPFRGKLSAVDVKAQTITIEGKEQSRTFQITGQTRIFKAGQTATLEDAKVGEEVGGYAEKGADDKITVRTLRIGPKPEGEKKLEKAGDAKEKKKE